MAEAMDPEARATSLADVTLKDISTRYTLKNELGSGAQATVYLGQSKGSGSSKVAIKVLPLAELEDDEVYEALRMECTLAKQLRHPYIVQMVEVCRDKENVYVVMECLGGGELFEHLLAKGPFKEDYALTIFAQVALAVDYMHSVDIVHRDLKAENLVFAAKGSPVVKFIDFGGASTCGEGGLTGLVGTPQYVAPEVVKGFGDDSPTEIPYGKGCDLWSMVRPRHTPRRRRVPRRPAAPPPPLPLPLTARLLSSQGVLLYVMLEDDAVPRRTSTSCCARSSRANSRSRPRTGGARLGRGARPRHQAAVRRPRQAPHHRRRQGAPVVRGGGRQVHGHDAEGEGGARAAQVGGRRRRPAQGPRPRPRHVGDVDRAEGVEGEGEEEPVRRRLRLEGGAVLVRYRRRASDAQRTHTRHAASSSPRAAPPAPLRYDIGDPTDVKQTAGAKLNADGTFNMDNVPEEMKAILADIEAKKAKAAGGGGRVSVQVPAGAPPPPPARRRRRRARRPTRVWTRRRRRGGRSAPRRTQ